MTMTSDPTAVTEESARSSFTIKVSVDNNHCHLFAICQQEAPEVFQLVNDRKLVFTARPASHLLDKVRHAARLCPMQAIEIVEQP
jgi:ferredoxin